MAKECKVKEFELEIPQKAFIGEEKRTYESLDKFHAHNVVNRAEYKQQDFSDMIYNIYPTFFLRGIVFNGQCVIIDHMGNVVVSDTLAKHHPKAYMYFRLSSLVRLLLTISKWPIEPSQVAEITQRCEDDFSDEYLNFFPYVVRVYTSNEAKKEDYSSIFPSVEFTTFEFEEIQGDVDDVTRAKLEDLEDEAEEDDMSVVDDVGVELYALKGAPGPYIKYFMNTIGPAGIQELCDKYRDRRIMIHQSVAVRYYVKGEVHRILMHAYFPCSWVWTVERQRDAVPGSKGSSGYDPYVDYCGERIFNLKTHQRFRQILMGWVWHRFKRRIRERHGELLKD